MKIYIDPRIKIFIALLISTCGVFFDTLDKLLILLIIAFIYGLILKVEYISLYFKIKIYLKFFLGIIIIQSIFASGGNSILSLGNVVTLTDKGLFLGIHYFLRILIIILSGAIMTTSSSRNILQGFVQLKLPYEIAFMVALSIKFIPIFSQEIENVLASIQLRGIDIKNLKFKKKIELLSSLFMPLIMNILVRGKEISNSVEARGFRKYNKRTSLNKLKFLKLDFLFGSVSLLVFYILIFIL